MVDRMTDTTRLILAVAASLLVALGAMGAASAQAPAATLPDGEGMQVIVPQGWGLDRRGTQPNVDEVYLTPESGSGRTQEDWLIYREYKGQGGLDPLVVLQQLVQGTAQVCPGMRAGQMQKGQVNGYPAGFVLMSCPNSRRLGRGVVTMVKVISAKDSVYQVERVWYYPPFDVARPPITGTESSSWIQFLSHISVCDTRDSRHPCR